MADDNTTTPVNPEEIPVALEELLRRFGISFIGRAVAKDQTFHGVFMKEGDVVCAGTPIALAIR